VSTSPENGKAAHAAAANWIVNRSDASDLVEIRAVKLECSDNMNLKIR